LVAAAAVVAPKDLLQAAEVVLVKLFKDIL